MSEQHMLCILATPLTHLQTEHLAYNYGHVMFTLFRILMHRDILSPDQGQIVLRIR